MVRLFKKFGWILALIVILLSVVVGIVVIIKDSQSNITKGSKTDILQEKKIGPQVKEEFVKEVFKNDQESGAGLVNTEKLDGLVSKEIGLNNDQKKESLLQQSLETKSDANSGIKTENFKLKSDLNSKNISKPKIEDLSLLESPNEESVSSNPKSSEVQLLENNDKAQLKQKEIDSTLSIDVMRVDEEGGTLVAGRTKPNANVEVLVGKKVIAAAESNEDGDFVVMGNIDESSVSQTITVRSGSEKESNLEDDIEVSMIDQSKRKNQSDDQALIEEELEWTLSEDIFVVLPVIIKNNSKSKLTEIKAPVIIQSSPDEIKIIQKNTSLVEEIIIDSISYSALGEAILVGRANPSNKVLIYLNNVLRGLTQVGRSGGWSTELTGLEPGIYELRIDEVDGAGLVQSRIMTPFKKESKDFLMNMVSGAITVQTGNSLWRIARRIFGQGIRYIEIFEKNSDLITDPNLIYPGQVFSIPTDN